MNRESFDISVKPVPLPEILPVRTQVLRPHFEAGQLAHFDGDDLEDTFHFAAYAPDGEVIGCASFMARPSPMGDDAAVQLRGMAVTESLQGQGVGARILAAALIELPFLLPERPVLWCNARESAMKFYGQQGFEVFGERFQVQNIGPHFVMWREFPLMVA